MANRVRMIAVAILAAVFLAGCQVSDYSTAKHLAPVPGALKRKMALLDMEERAPILVRIFKEDDELEVWKKKRNGEYGLLETFEICAWSGDLGPKLKEGDRQAPEGFYTIHPYQMNPNSDYHLAFNLGFPNQFDRAHGRTGSFLMVHGACSSRGCYAMEDDQIEIIYALARDAFLGGQRAFQVQAFPFRMTPENLAEHHDHEWIDFWKMLKEGYDHFEVTKKAPKVDVCGRRYVFNARPRNGGDFNPNGDCPLYDVPQDIWVQVASKQRRDEERLERLLAAQERREDREDLWDARRAMVASFFGNDGGAADRAEADSIVAAVRGPAVGASAAASSIVPETARTGRPEAGDDARTRTAAVGAVPVPRPAPRAGSAGSAGGGFGIRLPNLFGGGGDDRDESPSVAAAEPTPAAAANPAEVRRATPEAPAAPADQARDATEEEDRGVLAGVAAGTRDAIGAASSGVGNLWKGATGLFGN